MKPIDHTPRSKDLLLISKRAGRAIGDYQMMQDGDRILVAVSGGKDSLTLLHVLLYRQPFIPIKTELKVVHVDLGFPGFPLKKLIAHFEGLGVDYHIEPVAMTQRKTQASWDCFWCSWTRRKALFALAQRWGFNKIAFGHHQDDIVETILLNLFFRGEIGAMKPRQDFFQGAVTAIRPLAYERERCIAQFARAQGLDKVCPYACPRSEKTQRHMVKNLLARLEKSYPSIPGNIFQGLTNIRQEYLLDCEDKF